MRRDGVAVHPGPPQIPLPPPSQTRNPLSYQQRDYGYRPGLYIIKLPYSAAAQASPAEDALAYCPPSQSSQ